MLFRYTAFIVLYLKEMFSFQNEQSLTCDHALLTLNWLAKAQDAQTDGGVSAYYSSTRGWAPSFIETTGYCIGTYLNYAPLYPELPLLQRAEKMAVFLLNMQLDSGGFRTYTPAVDPNSQPTIFNTAQDLIGLCDFYQHSKKIIYLNAAVKAANFLLRNQEKDGSWIEKTYGGKKHTYQTRVALALIKTYLLTGDIRYKKAAHQNLEWTLAQQHPNGWFAHAELPGFPAHDPITHTIAYVLEGLLFSGLLLNEGRYVKAAIRSLIQLGRQYDTDGTLWATYSQNWQATSRYECLTGTAQCAQLFLIAGSLFNYHVFTERGTRLLTSVKKAQIISSIDPALIGAVAGSRPVFGSLTTLTGYCRAAVINWGAKFFLDACFHARMTSTTFKKDGYVYT